MSITLKLKQNTRRTRSLWKVNSSSQTEEEPELRVPLVMSSPYVPFPGSHDQEHQEKCKWALLSRESLRKIPLALAQGLDQGPSSCPGSEEMPHFIFSLLLSLCSMIQESGICTRQRNSQKLILWGKGNFLLGRAAVLRWCGFHPSFCPLSTWAGIEPKWWSMWQNTKE